MVIIANKCHGSYYYQNIELCKITT